MTGDALNSRIELLIKLLNEYIKAYNELADISAGIEGRLTDYYSSMFNKNLPQIQEQLDKHNSNTERTRQINDEITKAANSWYDFVKDPSQISRLTFPLHFFKRGKSLKRMIKCLNEELSSIVIENRFITEQATIWEHKLETDIIREIREGEAYSEYEKTTARLDAIIHELRYLAPTVPGLCPIEINSSSIDPLIEKLRRSIAAT